MRSPFLLVGVGLALGASAACGRIDFDSIATANAPEDANADANDIPEIDAATGLSGAAPRRLALGLYHTCVLIGFDELSEVWCWGSNTDGAVGQGGTGGSVDAPLPVSLPAPASWVATGGNHSCAVVDGGVYCWGMNTSGQLGVGGTSAGTGTPSLVMGIPAGATQVAAGVEHTCALVGDQVWCWGRNDSGQVGNGGLESPQLAPVQVPGLAGADSLVVRSDSSCAQVGGGIRCWGHNDAGMFVPDGPQFLLTPTELSLTDGTTQFALGSNSLYMLADGELVSRGANNAGQLGNGNNLNASNNQLVLGLPGPASDVAASPGSETTGFACAASNGRVWCWGHGASGRLGNGDTQASNTAVQVQGLPADDGYQVAAGGAHACVLNKAQAMWCWGAGAAGQLGDQQRSTSTTAVTVHPPI